MCATLLGCALELYSAEPLKQPKMDSGAFICSCICNALHLYSTSCVYVLDYHIRPTMDSAVRVGSCIGSALRHSYPVAFVFVMDLYSAELGFSRLWFQLHLYAVAFVFNCVCRGLKWNAHWICTQLNIQLNYEPVFI